MKIEFYIKEIRKSKKVTLKQLEKKSGISKTQINDIEKGYKMPSIFTLELIAMGLEVTIDKLYKFYKN